MSPQPPPAPDDEPTAVTPRPDAPPASTIDQRLAAGAAAAPTDAGLWPDPPRVEQTTAPEVSQDAGTAAGEIPSPAGPPAPEASGASAGAGGAAPTGTAPAGGAAAAADVPPPATPPTGDAASADPTGPGGAATGDESSTRGRRAADRTAEGAKVAAGKVSQAASATAQALRDTDVGEIARNTTRMIETTRPFFLTAFAIIFTFLAAVEDHASIGVVFAVAALLCVLGAAFGNVLDRRSR